MHGNVGTSRHIQRALPEFGEIIEGILQTLGREIGLRQSSKWRFPAPHPPSDACVAARIEGAKVTHQ